MLAEQEKEEMTPKVQEVGGTGDQVTGSGIEVIETEVDGSETEVKTHRGMTDDTDKTGTATDPGNDRHIKHCQTGNDRHIRHCQTGNDRHIRHCLSDR
jgi:hypothetical protein